MQKTKFELPKIETWMKVEVDWRKAMCGGVILFQEENYQEDLEGTNGVDRQEYAETLLAERGRGDLTAMVMDLETEAMEYIRQMVGFENRLNSSYDNNELHVGFPVMNFKQVYELGELFFKDMRSGGATIENLMYIDISALVFWPQGYNGPCIASESSVLSGANRNLGDLYDYWNAYLQGEERGTKERLRARRTKR